MWHLRNFVGGKKRKKKTNEWTGVSYSSSLGNIGEMPVIHLIYNHAEGSC